MKKLMLVIAAFPVLVASQSFAATSSISVLPELVQQGEPLMVTVNNTGSTTVRSLQFNGRQLNTFVYQSKPAALIGIDLNRKPGTTTITAVLNDGQIIEKHVMIHERKKYEAPMGIPQKLGGNSTTSQQQLVSSLTNENAVLNNLWTGKKAYWWEPFGYPLATPVVTDEFGYSRKTGSYNIAHRGTDFRAQTGTNIVSMNRGVVRLARKFRIYGNTVVVDHGLGVMTMYMHLSKIHVNEGQLVQKGQLLGKSGDTGYAEAPHLHLTVRINNISVDPMEFIGLFSKR